MDIKLISYTQNPITTIAQLWEASRSDKAINTFDNDHTLSMSKEDKRLELFRKVILSDIPVAENLEFVFLLEDIPIALREQIVRHRVGHKFGETFGVDHIPDLQGSSWWSQSMRVMSMGEFATDGKYYIPKEWTTEQEEVMVDCMLGIQDAYNALIKLGLPPEDARLVIPLAATHRISWKMSFPSLRNILGKRGCWIAQLGMWKPIILGMVKQLSEQIDPIFNDLVLPPCLKPQSNSFQGCPFVPDNIERWVGNDPEPPCPLFLVHHEDQLPSERDDGSDLEMAPTTVGTFCYLGGGEKQKRFETLQQEFAALWNRSIWSGSL